MQNQYFEGWYFKCSTQGDTLAIIVGRAKGIEPVAFIQIFSSKEVKSYYITYDIESYSYCEEPFHIQIEENIFTNKYIKLSIRQEDFFIEGRMMFECLTKLPDRLGCEGLMGPFGYLPFMECYHDVLSMTHTLKGQVNLNGVLYHFNDGKGYIERDWGTSFPSSYIWMQCNHFKEESQSFMLAIAKIPFLGSEFTGFLCVLSIKGQTRIFATYTGARIKSFSTKKDGVYITIQQGKELIRIKTKYKEGSLLKAPNKGAMQRNIYESLNSSIDLSIFYKGELKVCTRGENVAFERVGEIQDFNHKTS